MPHPPKPPRIDRTEWLAANAKRTTAPSRSWWLEGDFYAQQHVEQQRMLGVTYADLKLDEHKQNTLGHARLRLVR